MRGSLTIEMIATQPLFHSFGGIVGGRVIDASLSELTFFQQRAQYSASFQLQTFSPSYSYLPQSRYTIEELSFGLSRLVCFRHLF